VPVVESESPFDESDCAPNARALYLDPAPETLAPIFGEQRDDPLAVHAANSVRANGRLAMQRISTNHATKECPRVRDLRCQSIAGSSKRRERAGRRSKAAPTDFAAGANPRSACCARPGVIGAMQVVAGASRSTRPPPRRRPYQRQRGLSCGLSTLSARGTPSARTGHY
jgi:hypothetical protein